MAGQHFWGTGWSFPPTFDSANKQLRMAVNAESVNQSIALILSTQSGERAMNPQFGSMLKRYLFGDMNPNTLNQMKKTVEHALLHFEPRIKVEDLALKVASSNQSMLHIEIHYRILHDNTRHNVVFPYLFKEGTLLSPYQKGLVDDISATALPLTTAHDGKG